ncbi:hypothetical protein H4219_005232 [Mycoemilia scoparia]|uniref:Uncharacterized protein n=1 Tax=Mycoemilia scoparia TaxID=417184 RepID=A0A9W7ZPV4_9FUNG|nr:hypothetical protein H4219_005232 [Mycoemilia scoparia]
MQSASDTLPGFDRGFPLATMFYFENILFKVLSHICHTNATGLTEELTEHLESIGSQSSPNWTENTNINEWALGIKQADQALIDQAKDYIDAHGLTKNDQNPSGTDNGMVLCIWKLYFAIHLVQHLYFNLILLERPVDVVTTDDCINMFGQIKQIVGPTLGTINADNLDAYFTEFLSNDANAVNPGHVVQKIDECIASEPVDITDSVKAITFDVDGKAVNLVDHINNLVGLFHPTGESQSNISSLPPQLDTF